MRVELTKMRVALTEMCDELIKIWVELTEMRDQLTRVRVELTEMRKVDQGAGRTDRDGSRIT